MKVKMKLTEQEVSKAVAHYCYVYNGNIEFAGVIPETNEFEFIINKPYEEGKKG